MAKKKDTVINNVNIKEIHNPNDVKKFSDAELDVLCKQIRDELVTATSINGGHLSSNLGVVEATVALCRSFDFTKDKIIFDVGHQSYVYKLLTGRSLERLRQKDGVAGFQKMRESPYDHYECGHSSTSISAASGLAVARDFKGEDYHVIAFIGDASIVNGLAFEGINSLADSKHKMIIVINDNEMSISPSVGGMARFFRRLSTSRVYARSKKAYLKFFRVNVNKPSKIHRLATKIKNSLKKMVLKHSIFDDLGFSIVGPIDGHNIKKLEKGFEIAKRQKNTTVVLLKTIKGKGYLPAEKDITGAWHGVSPFDKTTGEAINPTSYTWSEVIADKLLETMREDQDTFLISAATGLGSAINIVHEEFPRRSIDVGIAEEHALTMASGLSVSGIHPIISLYSTFLQRGYDQISHDLARLKCPATILVDRAGFAGGDGDTHQGIYDVSFLYSIPNTTVTMPSRTSEIKTLFDESYRHEVFVIRYPKVAVYVSNEIDVNVPYGGWRKEIIKNNKTALVAVGPIVEELKRAINNQHLNVDLFNAIYLKPLLNETLKDLLKYQKVIIYDTYSVKSGFADHLVTRLVELKYQGELIVKAIPDEFIAQASIVEQQKEYHLTIEDILALL